MAVAEPLGAMEAAAGVSMETPGFSWRGRVKTPEVTVAIPTYNGESYLEECLVSALSQSVSDMEIVVVDDCSTDRTWAVVEAYSKRDERIRAFRNPVRLGLVGNWNRSIRHSTGEWIKFLFQDDVLADTCVEHMLEAVDSGSAPSPFVTCDRRFIIESGVPAPLGNFYRDRIIPLKMIFPGQEFVSAHRFSKAVLERGVGENFIGEPSSVMIRRDKFFEYGGFNPNLVHLCDLEYWTRVGTHEGMVYIPQPLNSFRVHPQSASAHHHASKAVEVNYLDRLVLLHDYLFHPLYKQLRDVPGGQATLEGQLSREIHRMNEVLAGARGSVSLIFQEFLDRYPVLKGIWNGNRV
jgi:glycosyltransferase involved in cell wall biosynthesis